MLVPIVQRIPQAHLQKRKLPAVTLLSAGYFEKCLGNWKQWTWEPALQTSAHCQPDTEFDLWDPHHGRRELTPGNCPLTFTCKLLNHSFLIAAPLPNKEMQKLLFKKRFLTKENNVFFILSNTSFPLHLLCPKRDDLRFLAQWQKLNSYGDTDATSRNKVLDNFNVVP